MDRATWTDERLDDLANRMDAGFDRVGRDIRELRTELRGEISGLREEMRGEISGLRGELGSEISGLRGELGSLRLTMLRTGGGIMVGLVGVIAAVFVNGP
jgi:hypothetical protein